MRATHDIRKGFPAGLRGLFRGLPDGVAEHVVGALEDPERPEVGRGAADVAIGPVALAAEELRGGRRRSEGEIGGDDLDDVGDLRRHAVGTRPVGRLGFAAADLVQQPGDFRRRRDFGGARLHLAVAVQRLAEHRPFPHAQPDLVRQARARAAGDGRNRNAAALQDGMDLAEAVGFAAGQQRRQDPGAGVDAGHAVGNRAEPGGPVALQQPERFGRGAADVEVQRRKSEAPAFRAVAGQDQPEVGQRRQPRPMLRARQPRALLVHAVFRLARHQVRAAARLRDHHAAQPALG